MKNRAKNKFPNQSPKGDPGNERVEITTAGHVELLRLSLADLFRKIEGQEYIDPLGIRGLKASTNKTLKEVAAELGKYQKHDLINNFDDPTLEVGN